MERRQGVLKGEDNVIKLLYVYSKMINKKIMLDPAIHDLKAGMGKVGSKGARDILIDQIEIAKGIYHWQDKVFDSMVESFNEKLEKVIGKVVGVKPVISAKPMALSRTLSKIRGVEANLKLGYRPVTAFVNFAGGHGHTWVKYGKDYMKKAYEFLKTRQGQDFILEEEPHLAVAHSVDIGGNPVPLAGKGKLKKLHPLYLFTSAELPTRKLGITAAYLYAKDNLYNEQGERYSDAEARAFARRSVRFNQFVYNMVSMPKWMRSPLGRTVGQFKSYLIQEMQFISQLKGIEFLRYAGLQMALAGPRGIIYLLRSFPFLSVMGLLDSLEEWMNKKHDDIPLIGNAIPTLSRGIVGLLGGDISAPAVVQLPNRLEDWSGPFFSDVFKLYKTVMKPFLETGEMDIRDVKDWVNSLAPAMYYWNQAIDAYTDPEGWVRDRNGEKLYLVDSDWQYMLLAMSIPPIEKTQADVVRRVLRREEKVRKQKVNKAVNELVSLLREEKPIPQELWDKVALLKIPATTIRQAYMRQTLPPEIRETKQAARARRKRVYQAYEDIKP
jgi:hypothetical protein